MSKAPTNRNITQGMRKAASNTAWPFSRSPAGPYGKELCCFIVHSLDQLDLQRDLRRAFINADE